MTYLIQNISDSAILGLKAAVMFCLSHTKCSTFKQVFPLFENPAYYLISNAWRILVFFVLITLVKLLAFHYIYLLMIFSIINSVIFLSFEINCNTIYSND